MPATADTEVTTLQNSMQQATCPSIPGFYHLARHRCRPFATDCVHEKHLAQPTVVAVASHRTEIVCEPVSTQRNDNVDSFFAIYMRVLDTKHYDMEISNRDV